MIRQTRRAAASWVAGIYRPGKARAMLFERLSDLEPHRLSEVLQELPVRNPRACLRRVTIRGQNPKPGQLYRWKITKDESADVIQMSDLERL